MVCRCSGLCFFPSSSSSFSSSFYYSCCRRCFFPLRRRRRALFFFVHLYVLFFPRSADAISRPPDRVMFYLSTFCTVGAVSFVFSYIYYIRPPSPSFTCARRRRRVYASRIIICCCKKTQPIRSCAESWNSAVAATVLFQLSFSTSHRSGFARRTWIIIYRLRFGLGDRRYEYYSRKT